MRLLLASKSPARRHMLEAAGVPFQLVEAPLEEDGAKAGLVAAGFAPRDLAEMLAEMKAKSAVAPADAMALGADQVLETAAGAILSKPGSREEALDQLRTLSGQIHYLHSAAVIVEQGERSWGCTETAAMKVRSLGDDFLRAYLDVEYDAARGNVGGYRIEGLGAQLFEAVEGSHFAVLGLPLLPLLAYLRERRILPS